MAQALGQAFAQSFDRLGLVAGGLEVGDEPEIGHWNLVGVGASSIPPRAAISTDVRWRTT